jgi:hypothetical protein
MDCLDECNYRVPLPVRDRKPSATAFRTLTTAHIASLQSARSRGPAAEECGWPCRMRLARHLRGFPVKAKTAGAEGNDVEEPAGHHQVLVEVYHVALISGLQMHAKSGAQAHKGK